jgi:hypothetical protein
MRLPQFTIRDLLWLMVVVGLSLGWLAEHRYSRELREQLQRAWWHYGPGWRTGASAEVDWSVLNGSSPDRSFDYNAGFPKRK